MGRNSGVEGALDVVDLAKFCRRERRNAVLHAERLQFIPGVDAPLIGSGFDQRGFGGLVLRKTSPPRPPLSTLGRRAISAVPGARVYAL